MARFLCLEGCPPKCDEYRSDPRVFLTHLWAFILILVGLLVAFSIYAAYAYANHHNKNPGISFAGIWAMLMAVSLTVYTHFALTAPSWRPSFYVGFLIGASALMSQFFLVLGVIYADIAADHDNHSNSDSKDYDVANEAMSASCFFLFAAYGYFTFTLVKHRGDVIVAPPPAGSQEK